MATPTVRSSSSNTASSGTSVTVTKPAGTIDGDLLVAIHGVFDASGDAVAPNDETGWTDIANDSQSDIVAFKAYYKTASSEGASYTFDTGLSLDRHFAVVYAIQDWDGLVPIIGNGKQDSVTQNPSVSISVAPVVDAALLINFVISGTISDAAADIISYTISGTNPTWTERQSVDDGVNYLASTATATASNNSTITSLSWNVGGAGSHTGAKHIGVLIAVKGVQDKTVTPSSVALTGNFSDAVASTETNLTTTSLSISGSVNEPTTAVVQQTVWTNESKPSTTWTNETL